MAKIIRNKSIVEDHWNVVRLAEGESAGTLKLAEGDQLFPLSVWQARKQEIISSYKRIGLWLDSHEAVEAIVDDLDYFKVVAINFPKLGDGSG